MLQLRLRGRLNGSVGGKPPLLGKPYILITCFTYNAELASLESISLLTYNLAVCYKVALVK